MDIWAVSSFWLFCIMLLWAFTHKFLCGHVFFGGVGGAVLALFFAEASRAGILWTLYDLWHCWEESSSEVRKIFPGEFCKGSDELVGAEEGASSQWCLKNVEFSVQCGIKQCGLGWSPGRCLICRGRVILPLKTVTSSRHCLRLMSTSWLC